MDQVPIFTAFAAGLVSFLSPCVLPLVPGYISIISGSSLDQLKAHEKDSSLFRTVLMNSILFIVGFSITFILLGASATWIGQVLASRMRLFGQLAGLVLIVFGIHLTGLIKINALYKDKRFHNVQKPRGMLGALVLGLAFAFGWTPSSAQFWPVFLRLPVQSRRSPRVCSSLPSTLQASVSPFC